MTPKWIGLTPILQSQRHQNRGQNIDCCQTFHEKTDDQKENVNDQQDQHRFLVLWIKCFRQ